ncbi:hypothetical protein NDU88_003470 [Pleurodeles waltl]|uniref:Uncharacterized protein n=1 Tax=Pleurodeles waltl TaxID=8319 RepID=A0AAV7W707_PLEWA|nr:hypothetical protein NDU88_003470 [Pleurodeles waltl]
MRKAGSVNVTAPTVYKYTWGLDRKTFPEDCDRVSESYSNKPKLTQDCLWGQARSTWITWNARNERVLLRSEDRTAHGAQVRKAAKETATFPQLSIEMHVHVKTI